VALLEDKKRRFFLELDRGGTVRAAAAAVGVSADIGYRWCRQAGVSTPRGAPRQYTEQDKARFFELLSMRGNVSAVAKELGFTRVTCYQWAHKAGIFTSEYSRRRREDYLRLRSTGVSRAEAAAAAGVHLRAAADLGQGHQANRRRTCLVYPQTAASRATAPQCRP
jgi:IS30 family transposase